MFSVVFTAISKDDDDVGNKFRCNGYSDEFLDRIEPNGNILRAKQHSSTSDARIGNKYKKYNKKVEINE